MKDSHRSFTYALLALLLVFLSISDSKAQEAVFEGGESVEEDKFLEEHEFLEEDQLFEESEFTYEMIDIASVLEDQAYSILSAADVTATMAARERFEEFIEEGAGRVDDKYEADLAVNNLEIFTQHLVAVVNNKEEGDKTLLDLSDYLQAVTSLCPLYPFC